jgi:hypothetical protein
VRIRKNSVMPYRQFSERKSVHRYGGETRDGLGFIGVQDSENIGEQGRDDSDRHYLVHFCQNGRPAKDKSSRLGTHDGGSGLGRPIGLVEFFLFTVIAACTSASTSLINATAIALSKRKYGTCWLEWGASGNWRSHQD